MILSKHIEIRISQRNVTHYKKFGYDAKINNCLIVDVCHLTKGSVVSVQVRCDICGKEKFLSYQKYAKSIKSYDFYACSQKCSVKKCENTFVKIYGEKHPSKNKTVKSKCKSTNQKKYGKDYFFQTDDFKTKFKETSLKKHNCDHHMKNKEVVENFKCCILKKYGVENVSFLESIQNQIKKTKIENKIILPDNLVDDFKLYRRKVKNYTYGCKKILFESWNGYDYYDNEYIKEYKSLHCMNKNYPTIDHKTSVFYGFLNNINPQIIGGINNLCITKKSLNSSKGIKCFINTSL